MSIFRGGAYFLTKLVDIDTELKQSELLISQRSYEKYIV